MSRLIQRKGSFVTVFDLAMNRAYSRCQVLWGADFERCGEVATEVLEEDGPNYVAMCTACRRKTFGPSPAESRLHTLQRKARQMKLFGES